MATAADVLQVASVAKAFGGIAALDDVTLSVRSGEIYGLIGPNGAGKTTLFNCVSGLVRVDRGTISLNGKRTDRLRPYEIVGHGIARTFQNVRLLPSLTILENVAMAAIYRTRSMLPHVMLGLPITRREKRDLTERAEALLARLADGQLYPRRHDFANELSTGQQRMLEVIRAMMSAPALVLLDEPTSGLNPVWIKQMVDLIRSIRVGGTAVFIIEHNMPVIMDIADRIAVLHFGRKLAEGSAKEIRGNPDVVQAYLGSRAA